MIVQKISMDILTGMAVKSMDKKLTSSGFQKGIVARSKAKGATDMNRMIPPIKITQKRIIPLEPFDVFI
ncbi:hypothetical protein [Planomicrobium okeanokoites]|uniref:hypothetical protein n=1 Tax=Planomicrobium okeanokoites TaxID=244 RepID=UPI001182C105|nr:hypothetical protein [Planomicrobium okeanokoites]